MRGSWGKSGGCWQKLRQETTNCSTGKTFSLYSWIPEQKMVNIFHYHIPNIFLLCLPTLLVCDLIHILRLEQAVVVQVGAHLPPQHGDTLSSNRQSVSLCHKNISFYSHVSCQFWLLLAIFSKEAMNFGSEKYTSI